MKARDRTYSVGRVATPASAAQCLEETVWAPSLGTYITDGLGLFRVEDAVSSVGELFLELEDCATLELIVCAARTVGELGLRTVVPTSASASASA
jgi:hypothetical protein